MFVWRVYPIADEYSFASLQVVNGSWNVMEKVLLRAGSLIWALFASLLITGCSTYHYFIVEPAEFTQQVTKREMEVVRGPLQYQFSERHHRLSLAVRNPGSNALAIVERRSYVVSPDGQTHSLWGGSIAPGSYVTMTLPPEPPMAHGGPTFSFGMGYGYGWSPHSPWAGVYEPFYSPQSYYIYDGHDSRYWEWRKGRVRMRLSFEGEKPGAGEIAHDWVLERRRIK